MAHALLEADEALFHYVNGSFGGPALDLFMMALSSKYTWLAFGLAILLFSVWKRQKKLLKLCLLLGVSVGLSDFLAYQVIKPMVGRERPCVQLADIRLVPHWCGGDYGFPSNHAANGMAMTTVIALSGFSTFALVALALTLLTGLSRIYLGLHFPLDVIGGFVLGSAIGVACFRAWNLLQSRLGPRLSRFRRVKDLR